MEPLTQKQSKVLDFVERQLEIHRSPSQREIARHFGLAQNAVYQLVCYLKQKGYLVNAGGHRGLRLSAAYIRTRGRTGGVPIVGRVAAGEPILAEQNIEGYVKLDEMFGKDKNIFLLKVVGDSMVDEGIMDGDFVVVKPASMVENGQIGVVLLDDEATVKRVYVRLDRVALKPANKAAGYKTRYVKRGGKSVRIIGQVKGCLKVL
jgi:repressor LexA